MNAQHIKQALEKAYSLQKSGSITQAKEICEDILLEEETSFDTHNLLGICQYQLEEFDSSIISIQRAIELNPNDLNSDSYFKLGDCYKHNKDSKNALLYFKKAVKGNHNCHLCYHNIADSYNKLNKFELCIFNLQKAIKLCPDSFDSLFLMVQCYRKMKNEKKMMEYIHKTLEKLPEHPGANHFLASLNKETSSKYSLEYAEDLFDRYADHFEEHLINSLKYQVPFIIKEKLQYLNLPRDSEILDLGCGTGLVGKTLVDLFPHLVGVDISTNMIEETRKKDIYTTLHINDINDFLFKNIQNFDLIIAADVFIYIGAIQTIFSSVRKCLPSNGYFIFTIELSLENNMENYQLSKSGRFSHSMEYIESLCKETEFEIVEKEEIILREENKTGQKGVIFTLKNC
jgi:predicted TPR repeat methyltransferase